MNRRRLSPKSRFQNERIIERIYNGSGNGLVSDTFRVPDKSFGELYNARDHKSEVRGRQGSFLHTAAKFGLLPEDITGTFADAISTGGVLENASSGDIFQVYSFKDFTGGELQAAIEHRQSHLTPMLRAYDMFRLTSDVGDLEYLGNLAVPAIYYPTSDGNNPMVAEKVGNRIIKRCSGWGEYSNALVGTYFNWGTKGPLGSVANYRDYIVGYDVETGELITQNAGGVDDGEEYFYNFFQGPVYASGYHQALQKVVIQAEDRLYETDIPYNGWREIPGIYNSKLIDRTILTEERPQESEGLLHVVKSDMILSNNNGHYRVIFNPSGAYYFKINEMKPNTKTIGVPVKVWGFKESRTDDSVEVVGFPGYNNDGPRAGNKYFINGQIL